MEANVYLDNAATTCTDIRVTEAMLPYFSEIYGNASSLHHYGNNAKNAIETARKKIANYLCCNAEEIIFTSSGTEANNFALKGIASSNRQKGNHIIVSAIEHDCILNTCKWLETQGFFVTYVPVDNEGIVDMEFLKKCINPKTILISVMHVNNEIGSIQAIEEIGEICKEKQIFFHSDACQSFGKIPINTSNIDLLTVNSHKIYGSKGVGALIIKKNIPITPLLHGGGQEYDLRSSTENVAGIVGFAKAVELCYDEMESEYKRISALQKYATAELNKSVEGIYFNGSMGNRLAHNLNFCISGLEGESIRLLLLLNKEGIAISSGSACSSNGNNPASHVLEAIGLNPFQARGSVRLSMGRFTEKKDIDFFLESLLKNIKKLNSIYS